MAQGVDLFDCAYTAAGGGFQIQVGAVVAVGGGEGRGGRKIPFPPFGQPTPQQVGEEWAGEAGGGGKDCHVYIPHISTHFIHFPLSDQRRLRAQLSHQNAAAARRNIAGIAREPRPGIRGRRRRRGIINPGCHPGSRGTGRRRRGIINRARGHQGQPLVHVLPVSLTEEASDNCVVVCMGGHGRACERTGGHGRADGGVDVNPWSTSYR